MGKFKGHPASMTASDTLIKRFCGEMHLDLQQGAAQAESSSKARTAQVRGIAGAEWR